MQKVKLYLVIIICFLSFNVLARTKPDSDYGNIILGENLSYTAHWGILNIGSASTSIDKKLYKIGPTMCSRIEVHGQTNGIAKLFNVQDKWISYIDTSTIQTYKSIREIREGSYELNEIAEFDHINKKATVKVFDKNSKAFQLKKIYDTPENIRDIIAGFMFLRTMNFASYVIGDKITINGFYEDEGYKVDIVYAGKEILTMDNCTVSCHKLRPIIPKNKVFEGRNPVVVWLSDDNSQKVVKLQAKMLVGNIIIKLK